MIRNATARKILYAWHGGQNSAFYAAASSGLVSHDDEERIFFECKDITDEKTRFKMLDWLSEQFAYPVSVAVSPSGHRMPSSKNPRDYYTVLPWSYINVREIK